jgi:uncharacterized protein YqeY
MIMKKIEQDTVKALKEGNKFRREVLANLVASIKRTAIDEKVREDIPEELVNRTILKEKKVLQEMIDTCPHEREDLRNKYSLQMAIIDEYCPKVLEDPAKIAEFIDLLIIEHPGINMKTMMPMLKGKVDMKTASKIVKEKL